ncbi:MAG: cytidylate kinase family protein, partial [Alloacidobacterium sp.]
MIRVITVEREYGSQGAEFAHHLAHHLQWKLVDQCLIDEIAAKAG